MVLSPENPNLSKEMVQIIDQVRNMQEACAPFVVPIPEEEIGRLLAAGLLYYHTENNEVVASFYLWPIVENVSPEDQVFLLGGMSLKGGPTSSTKEGRRTFFQFIKTEIAKLNLNLFATTTNDKISELFNELGFMELSFEECQQQYPKLLQELIGRSAREDKDTYYKDKKFYVRLKKPDEQRS